MFDFCCKNGAIFKKGMHPTLEQEGLLRNVTEYLLLLFIVFHKNILKFFVFMSKTNEVLLLWRLLGIVFKITTLCNGECIPLLCFTSNNFFIVSWELNFTIHKVGDE
jgi:hypothetical protein